jgi:hypothetical protein
VARRERHPALVLEAAEADVLLERYHRTAAP